jgi:hypothetical protein
VESGQKQSRTPLRLDHSFLHLMYVRAYFDQPHLLSSYLSYLVHLPLHPPLLAAFEMLQLINKFWLHLNQETQAVFWSYVEAAVLAAPASSSLDIPQPTEELSTPSNASALLASDAATLPLALHSRVPSIPDIPPCAPESRISQVRKPTKLPLRASIYSFRVPARTSSSLDHRTPSCQVCGSTCLVCPWSSNSPASTAPSVDPSRRDPSHFEDACNASRSSQDDFRSCRSASAESEARAEPEAAQVVQSMSMPGADMEIKGRQCPKSDSFPRLFSIHPAAS